MKKIGIVGCGAVTEKFHLPPLMVHEGVEVTHLVDKDRERADELAGAFGVANTATELSALYACDAAILAVPHFLHAPMAVELLKAGVPVLVEKPMAISSAECDAMLAAARESGASVCVGQMRRYNPSVSFVKEVLERGILGTIRKVDVREGGVFNWPVKSDFQFRKEAAGGGVLFDTGAHTLDTLIWWLGMPEVEAYEDDDYGGVEADCLMKLKLSSGVTATVELSRTRNLRNSAIIEGDHGHLEWDLATNNVRFTSFDSRFEGIMEANASSDSLQGLNLYAYLFHRQVEDWLHHLNGGGATVAPGDDARRVVDLMEACYAKRERLELPWMAV